MRIKNYIFIVIITYLYSCSNISFVYENTDKQNNKLYNKISYNVAGTDIPSVHRLVGNYYGQSKKPVYNLSIIVSQSKKKRSVQTNQAIAKLDYELKFNYELSHINKKCLVFNKNIYSRFTYVPKSSGYNFGSDQSLVRMYELAVKEGLDRFNDLVFNIDRLECKNEG